MSAPARVEIRVQVACFHDGRLLCALHRKRGREYWVLPGGHVEPGETLWRAARRELAEETSLELADGRLWALGEFLGEGRHVVECTFVALSWRGDPRVGTDPEAQRHPASLVALEWLDRDRFAGETFLPAPLGNRLRERWNDLDAPAVYLDPPR